LFNPLNIEFLRYFIRRKQLNVTFEGFSIIQTPNHLFFMMQRLLILFFCLFGNLLLAQSSAEVQLENIVPNGGFEQYAATPIGWFYKGQHFTNVMKFWSSPTAASPDIFGPKVRVPAHWADKGFGKMKPHGGESMVGLTLYGCDDGKPHCREYIQIQLKEPLVPSQGYYFEFWVNKLPRSLEINNMGLAFSKSKIDIKTDPILDLVPMFNYDDIVKINRSKWVKVSGEYTAKSSADYLIIGNFFDDTNTKIASKEGDLLPYAYYYVDDVLLRKVEPIVKIPVRPDDLSKIELAEGKVIQLRDIYFDTDKFELLPRSFTELDKLLDIMIAHPNMVIEITGHTDSQGEDNYNLFLSRKRAKAVAEYLQENGIKSSRFSYNGMGSNQPIASNDTDDGRQLNRRVEIMILKL
jgi:outer membrane protein OmpA-like peptidoglycan-associated protein